MWINFLSNHDCMILLKKIKGVLILNIRIEDVFKNNHEVKNAEITGNVFNLDSRLLRNDNYLTKIAVYDGTSSIYITLFSENEVKVKKGDDISAKGDIVFDRYNFGELTMKSSENNIKVLPKKEKKEEVKKEKEGLERISLQNFGFMTAKRGAVPAESFFKKASELGHQAVSITDLGVVQSFPEMPNLAKKYGVKPIYGMTALSVKDTVTVYNFKDIPLNTDIVVFDVETTGFSTVYNEVIEIGAAKIRDGAVVDTFQAFIKTSAFISETIQNLTNITPEILESQGQDIQTVLHSFNIFVGDSILAAHNAFFDLHMLEETYRKHNVNFEQKVMLDTLKISRKINENIKSHALGSLAKLYKVDLKNAHRADDDSKATAEILIQMLKQLNEAQITTTKELESYKKENDYKSEFPAEITIWVKNQIGMKNLYNIVSESHTKTLSRLGSYNARPVVTWDLINRNREGLIIGSGGYGGHLFDYAVNKPEHVLEKEMDLYDVIQLEPADVATHLVISDKPQIDKVEYLEDSWARIYRMAKEKGKFIIATDGAHYTEKEDALIHNVLIYSQLPASYRHEIRKAKMEYPMGPAHMRTTEEMMDSFPYLTNDEKEQYIVVNPNKMSDRIETVHPIPVDENGEPILFTPKIEGIDEKFNEVVYENARKQYGDVLPEIIEKRLEKEMESIIGNGFAVIYMISRELVKKSNEDGYLVGSRGSVGSSLAATLSEITEVNPMPPHYVCSECKWSVFFEGNESILSGYDLPDTFAELLDEDKFDQKSIENYVETFAKLFNVSYEVMKKTLEKHDGSCPRCKTSNLKKEGQNIPFETFLGFTGEKTPDIDLNFSGIYQPEAHKFIRDMFGESYVFRAGTITTVAEMTAFAFVNNYFKNHGVNISRAEVDRLKNKVMGAKDSTGQHPGGMLVVPKQKDMTDISPFQFPANNSNAEFMTSHFAYESVESSILKFDILGHDAPTLLRFLQDYTDVEPKNVPNSDKDVLDLFVDSKAVLGVSPDEYNAKTGTLGLPEMGTRVVQDVISETLPKGFGDLITLSGLTHGTDVYYNNAQTLIKENVATIREVIGCRDDIMRYLISMGLNPSLSFKIMESVRKGKGLTEEWEEEMKRYNVPEWYIWSCNQIKYMFPRAHASAYVLDATRIGYYKIKYPLAYYAAIFSSRYNAEDLTEFLGDAKETKAKINELTEEVSALMKSGQDNAANKKKRTIAALNVALEAKLRGIKWGMVDLYRSHKDRFLIDEETNTLIPPLSTINGLGESVANRVYEEKFKGVFRGITDLTKRTSMNKTVVALLDDLGCLEDVKESQIKFY